MNARKLSELRKTQEEGTSTRNLPRLIEVSVQVDKELEARQTIASFIKKIEDASVQFSCEELTIFSDIQQLTVTE